MAKRRDVSAMDHSHPPTQKPRPKVSRRFSLGASPDGYTYHPAKSASHLSLAAYWGGGLMMLSPPRRLMDES